MAHLQAIQSHFEAMVPGSWFDGGVSVESDGDEILCTGRLVAGDHARAFRERTRDERMEIAAEAQARFGRAVSWGVREGGSLVVFTNLNLPVMTRLRLRERKVLDTLVRGGVARSRSDALAWCVRLVAQHESEWLDELRRALADVEHVRERGPATS